jgi:hypothetical protein
LYLSEAFPAVLVSYKRYTATQIVRLVSENLDKLSTNTKVILVNFIFEYVRHNNDIISIIIDTLKDPVVFTETLQVFYYDVVDKKKYCNWIKNTNTKYGAHGSWYIHNLLYKLSPDLRMLLKLSITPITYLRSYDRMQIINYDICDKLITPASRFGNLANVPATSDKLITPVSSFENIANVLAASDNFHRSKARFASSPSLPAPNFRNKFTHYMSTTTDLVANEKFFNIDKEVENYIAEFQLFNKVFNIPD